MDWITLLAQQVGTTATDSWSDWSSTGVMGLVLIWGLTKGLPNALNIHKSSLEEQQKVFVSVIDNQQKLFSEELRLQRAEFREDLTAIREQSNRLVTDGYAAIDDTLRNLANSIENLQLQIDRVNGS